MAASTCITLSSTDPRVPTDARNTAWRMVERTLDLLHLRAEVHIHIDKQLPLQGGLGAGSANAVAALIGLQHELDRRLPPSQSPAAGGRDRLRRTPLSAGWRGSRGGTRGGGLSSSRHCLLPVRDRTPCNRGFHPPGLPRLGRPAFVDRDPPLSYNRRVESVDRCCIWRTALLRCLLRSSQYERRPGRGSASRACPNRDRKRLRTGRLSSASLSR